MSKRLSPAYALSMCLLGCGLAAGAAHAADGDWIKGAKDGDSPASCL